MVLRPSIRIPRVPMYSGYPSSLLNFVYGTVTLFGPPFQVRSTIKFSTKQGPNPPHITIWSLGSSNFARHYFQNRFFFLFLRVMRCFSSPGSPRIPIDSVYDTITLLMVSSLIRKSAGQRSFATLRSLSQLVTSFFGAIYQGILLCALCSLIFKSFDCSFAIRRIISFDTFQKILKLNFSVIIVLTFYNACINHSIFKFCLFLPSVLCS